MEVQVAETGPCSRSLTIKVPPPLVDEHLDEVYKSAQKQVQIKGFRPGKVPRAIIEKRFGESILAEAKEQLLNRYLGEACRTNEIQPVGNVEIDEFEQLTVKRGTELEFVARLDVRPTIELGDVTGIEVEAFETEATDEDIENALKQIAHEKRKMQPADDAAIDGDFLKANLKFFDEKGGTVREREGAQLQTRRPINGCEEEAYTKAVLGLKAGGTGEIAITYPDNFEVEAVRGQTGKVEVAVQEINRVTPAPIDDELAKGLDFETLDALKQDLGERIAAEKTRAGKQRQEEQCIEHLLEKHPVELPPSMVEQQKQAALGSLEQRIRESGDAGLTEEQIKAQLENAGGDASQEAEKRVRMFFLIDAVARKQELSVTQEDAMAEIQLIADANNATPAQVREHLEENNRLGELELALLERKVRDFLRANANAVDKKGS
ncbi:MAG: trigger factor [bacterium]|nr:trigger factor [bacterium]